MSKGWVNFAEVREKVSLRDVLLHYYGVSTWTTQTETKLVGPCPVHGGDSPRAFHADLTKNIWHCFSKCKKGGNQLDLVAQKEDISIRDAALRLQAFFLGGGEAEAPTPRPERRPPAQAARRSREQTAARPNPPLELELQLLHDHPHLLEDRGLSIVTTTLFDVGYCRRGIMRGCIALPIRDERGQLVAYAGRRLKPQQMRQYGKYKFPKGFRKELVLYNLDRAREADAKQLIMVEGFFSVLALYEADFENVVAIMGSDLSAEQGALLKGVPEVVLLLDGDDAGRAGMVKAKELLAPHTTVRSIFLPEGESPDEMPVRMLRWALNGVAMLGLTELRFEADTAKE